MAEMKTPYYVVVDWVDGQLAILRDFDIRYGIATETTDFSVPSVFGSDASHGYLIPQSDRSLSKT